MPERPYRFIYNCDGNNTFIHDEPPMGPGNVFPYVDEVAEHPVTTFFMSCHSGMDMNFQGTACDMVGARLTDAQWQRMRDPDVSGPRTTERAILNFHALREAGHDPLGLMLERSKERGMETFVTFRLNEVHGVEDPTSHLMSRFYVESPEYIIGTPGDPLPELYNQILGPVNPIVNSWIPGGLDFAERKVREHRLAEIAEVCERYDVDGLDLDFQRFPVYFRFGHEAQGIPYMNEFVRGVRAVTERAGSKRGRKMLLSARIMAKPEQNLGIGLDPAAWVQEGLLDFITISHYLRNTDELAIDEYRRIFPEGLPLYASIEFEREPDRYRELARDLWRRDVDGLMMFNFFASREGERQPPFFVLDELADRARMLEEQP